MWDRYGCAVLQFMRKLVWMNEYCQLLDRIWIMKWDRSDGN